jgi:uncharacterized protein (DUF433 family)
MGDGWHRRNDLARVGPGRSGDAGAGARGLCRRVRQHRGVTIPLAGRVSGITNRLRHNREMESVVVRDPEIIAGEPTFRGTRVLARTLFDYLEAGRSLEFFLEGYPTVGREMAKRALEEAKESLLAIH